MLVCGWMGDECIIGMFSALVDYHNLGGWLFSVHWQYIKICVESCNECIGDVKCTGRKICFD